MILLELESQLNPLLGGQGGVDHPIDVLYSREESERVREREREVGEWWFETRAPQNALRDQGSYIELLLITYPHTNTRCLFICRRL